MCLGAPSQAFSSAVVRGGTEDAVNQAVKQIEEVVEQVC